MWLPRELDGLITNRFWRSHTTSVCCSSASFANRKAIVFIFSLSQTLRTPLAAMSMFRSDFSSHDTWDWPRWGLAKENSITICSMALSVRFLWCRLGGGAAVSAHQYRLSELAFDVDKWFHARHHWGAMPLLRYQASQPVPVHPVFSEFQYLLRVSLLAQWLQIPVICVLRSKHQTAYPYLFGFLFLMCNGVLNGWINKVKSVAVTERIVIMYFAINLGDTDVIEIIDNGLFISKVKF